MKKLLIHVGTAKTGSSAIQRSLLGAQREGKLGAVCYPEFEHEEWTRVNPHALLGYLYRTNRVPRIFRWKDREELLKSLVPRFKQHLDRTLLEKDSIILSTEYMAGFNRKQVYRFREYIKPYAFDDVIVVVYVRHPADLYLSLVQQVLKASSAIRDPRNYRYGFRKAIANWRRAFGAKIVVRPYDRALLYRQCVVQDFLTISSGFFGQKMENVQTVNANESLSAEACVILQRYRKLFHGDMDRVRERDSGRLVKMLRQSRQALPQTSPRLRKEVEDLIVQRHRDDLIWLRSEYGIDFLTEASEPARNWNPPSDSLEVGDIMETREELVDELLFCVLRRALKPIRPK